VANLARTASRQEAGPRSSFARSKAIRNAGWSVVGFGTAAAFLALAALAHHQTSDEKFCGRCHSMGPVIEAFEASVHGGRNPSGTRTTCVLCHLPQEGLASLLLEKMRAGLHAYWVEMVIGTADIDWQAKREERLAYTFDSACLDCHRALRRSTSSSAEAQIAHQRFFLGNDKKCVSCHQRVGHAELSGFLYERAGASDQREDDRAAP
jgi:cytochrome c-type protein NapC